MHCTNIIIAHHNCDYGLVVKNRIMTVNTIDFITLQLRNLSKLCQMGLGEMQFLAKMNIQPLIFYFHPLLTNHDMLISPKTIRS